MTENPPPAPEEREAAHRQLVATWRTAERLATGVGVGGALMLLGNLGVGVYFALGHFWPGVALAAFWCVCSAMVMLSAHMTRGAWYAALTTSVNAEQAIRLVESMSEPRVERGGLEPPTRGS